jgi:hypothetical protein
MRNNDLFPNFEEIAPMRNMYKIALSFLTLSILPEIRHFFDTYQPIPLTPPEEPNNFLTEAETDDFRKKGFSKASVKIHPNYETHLRNTGNEEKIQKFKRTCVKKVRKAVCHSIVTKTQREAILSGVSFFVEPPVKGDQNTARWYGDGQEVHIDCSIDSTATTLKNAVRNEMFHAQVLQRNRALGYKSTDPMLSSEPYCDKNGKVNTTQANQLVEAIQADFKMLNYFYTIFMKKHDKKDHLSATEQAFYMQAMEILRDYQPYERTFTMERNIFLKGYKPFLVKTGNPKVPYKIPAHRLNIPIRLPSDQYFLSVKEGDICKIKSRYSENIDTPLDRAKAFLSDQIVGFNRMPKTPQYSGLSEAEISSELASDLEELPSAIKEFFFPHFCQFFSDFHAVTRYCFHFEP